MKNLILISSIIDSPNKKLANNVTRSVFTKQQRYEQTKLTIQSIRKYIPNVSIMIVECSDLTSEEKEYFESHCDYLLNLYDNIKVRENVYSSSKSQCETTQIINALEYIVSKQIEFDNLFKISGRYQLNSEFNYNLFENNQVVVKAIQNNKNNIFTALYKIPNKMLSSYIEFLIQSQKDTENNIGLEVIFSNFINKINLPSLIYKNIGLEGYVSVCGTKVYC